MDLATKLARWRRKDFSPSGQFRYCSKNEFVAFSVRPENLQKNNLISVSQLVLIGRTLMGL